MQPSPLLPRRPRSPSSVHAGTAWTRQLETAPARRFRISQVHRKPLSASPTLPSESKQAIAGGTDMSGKQTMLSGSVLPIIILPLMSISNSPRLLLAWVYQPLGKTKACLWDPVPSSCPSCCLLHLGMDRQLPVAAHSLYRSRCSCSLHAPLGL